MWVKRIKLASCKCKELITIYVVKVFIDIQTSKELIQMDTDKMMTYETFAMDDEIVIYAPGLMF